MNDKEIKEKDGLQLWVLLVSFVVLPGLIYFGLNVFLQNEQMDPDVFVSACGDSGYRIVELEDSFTCQNGSGRVMLSTPKS